MQAIYPYAQILHLIFAIIFLGYVFFDVVILGALRSKFGENFGQVKQTIGSKAIKIMPHCVLGLFLTGGMMMSAWVGSKAGGYFETSLQQIFMLKVFLACIIGVGIVLNLTLKAAGREPIPFMKAHFHKIVLALGFTIVILAKAMFLA